MIPITGRDPTGRYLLIGVLAQCTLVISLENSVVVVFLGMSADEARRRTPSKLLPCRVFRLGGQKSPWLVSAVDLADLIDRQRQKSS